MATFYFFVLLSSILSFALSFTGYSHRHSNFFLHNAKGEVSVVPPPEQAIDLTGYTILCEFTGFGVANMTCSMKLKDKFEVEFGRGIQSSSPGFWRTIKFENGDMYLEATHPVLAEYMLFFDIWDPKLLWRGKIDLQTSKIIDGEVTTNKKRLGIFPYKETLAVFSGNICAPNIEIPYVKIPSLLDQSFFPPEDFVSPYDMKRYPQYFSTEFIDWWFSVEDALAEGLEPPKRPKPYFTPELLIEQSEAKRSGFDAGAGKSSSNKSLRDKAKSSSSNIKSKSFEQNKKNN